MQLSKTKIVLFLILIFCSYQPLFSQIIVEKDTSKGYRDIENYSKKNKFMKELYKLIFVPVQSKSVATVQVVKKKNFENFENKIIRKINIITLDPFGYSETDTTKIPTNWLEKSGNKIHVKTKHFVIRNLLLLKKNAPLDSLLVRESERLIRNQRFINKVAITAEFASTSSDSVDVFVRVLDTWSIVPQGSVSNSSSAFELNERNFLGFGHEFDHRITTRYSDNKNAYNLLYVSPNIQNTFIKTTLGYNLDLNENYVKSINMERTFYSTYTKWAGGIYFDQQFRRDSIANIDLKFIKQNFKYNAQDFWLGRSFKILNAKSTNFKTTNLIVATRYLDLKYTENPTSEFDPVHFYSSEKLYLTGIGVASRQFILDKYIFKNGIVEDVPVGKTYGITAGYQQKNNQNNLYLGGRATFGNLFKWGFLSTNLECGSFFNNGKAQQTSYTFQTNYFTKLINIGDWKFRQFFKAQFIYGSNRLDSNLDRLNFNDTNGISGFTTKIYGTKKCILTLQTQAYSPWKVAGFRVNPFFNYTLGMLGNSQIEIDNNKSYSKISVGVIINNDYLVFGTFQFSLSFYPSIPYQGENIYKTNTLESSDFGFQNFDIEKPIIVQYR
jgi:hypothetical protein